MMSLSLASSALKPLTVATLGLLLIAILLVVVLSVIIARRSPRRSATRTIEPRATWPQPPPREEISVDMQERLQRLTGDLDEENEVLTPTLPPPPPITVMPPLPSPVPTSSIPADPSNDSFSFSADSDSPLTTAGDATAFFGGDSPSTTTGDATAFFGGEAASTTTGDATAFFGGDSPSTTTGDATAFFGGEAASTTTGDVADSHGALTTEEKRAEDTSTYTARHEDSTSFFGENAVADERHGDSTTFFEETRETTATTDSVASLSEPSSSHSNEGFFNSSDDSEAMVRRALPPMAHEDLHDASQESRQPSTAGIERMRDCLIAAEGPSILALSVIDRSGLVLAGETDEDLTSELLSLMNESSDKDATIEQPVVLADDAIGAILLLQTGSDARLGALIQDEGDAQGTRTRLHGLAHQIGDAMRDAS